MSSSSHSIQFDKDLARGCQTKRKKKWINQAFIDPVLIMSNMISLVEMQSNLVHNWKIIIRYSFLKKLDDTVCMQASLPLADPERE